MITKNKKRRAFGTILFEKERGNEAGGELCLF